MSSTTTSSPPLSSACAGLLPLAFYQAVTLTPDQLPTFSQLTLHDEPNFWHEHIVVECAEPGIRFLVDGIPGRVHQWRIAGNSIVIPQAIEVIKALKKTMIEDYGWR